MGIGLFGRLVIGEHAAEAEQVAVREGRQEFGPLILDHPMDKKPKKEKPKAKAKAAEPVHQLSVDELRKRLKVNPLEVDAFLRAEFARPDGLRKSALDAMVLAENRRPGQDGGVAPRAEVIDTLVSALASLES